MTYIRRQRVYYIIVQYQQRIVKASYTSLGSKNTKILGSYYLRILLYK